MAKLTAYERQLLIREKNRPTIHDYIPMLFEEYFELHGDRLFGDDGAITGGIALFEGKPVTVVSHVKGKTLAENQKSNFAMPHPEGYRKALRLIKQAEKFHRPVVCFIDSPGAYCGIGAEERGQGEAIARSLYELISVKTPILSIVLGEAGSGGALALGVCDELAMLENALYSVISPRGFASILWKDASKEKQAANAMRITAEDLTEFGICDAVIKEPGGGAHLNPAGAAQGIRAYLHAALERKSQIPLDILLETRYDRFRKIGEFEE